MKSCFICIQYHELCGKWNDSEGQIVANCFLECVCKERYRHFLFVGCTAFCSNVYGSN
jgi:hypothetical protein